MQKPEPIEIVLIGIPVLCEVIAAVLLVCAAVLWTGIWSRAI